MVRIDLTGRTPENWSCIDCGYNTAPRMLGGVELEKAIDANPDGVEQSIDAPTPKSALSVMPFGHKLAWSLWAAVFALVVLRNGSVAS
jgi:hypothetical protein